MKKKKKASNLKYLAIPGGAATGAYAYKKYKKHEALQQTPKAKLKRALKKTGKVLKAGAKVLPKAALVGAAAGAPALAISGLGLGGMAAGAKAGAIGGGAAGAIRGGTKGLLGAKNKFYGKGVRMVSAI